MKLFKNKGMTQKILSSFFMFLPFWGFSQELSDVVRVGVPDHKLMKQEWKTYFLNTVTQTMKMTYFESKAFDDTDYSIFCLESREIYLSFRNSFDGFGGNCSYPFLTSTDKEVMLFSSAYIGSNKEVDEHIDLVLKDNLSYLGKKDYKKNAFLYSKVKTRKRFNADKVFRYTVPLLPQDYVSRNGKEYRYVEKILVQHQGRGLVDFTCFYTDKARRNFEKYSKEIERLLRYEDD